MRRECSVSLIRRVALSRDRRNKHSCQITLDPQYAAFCKMWTFTKSQIINHVTTTEKAQLQLQRELFTRNEDASANLLIQLDETNITLGNRNLPAITGLQGSKQARLDNSLSPVESEALGVYLAKV